MVICKPTHRIKSYLIIILGGIINHESYNEEQNEIRISSNCESVQISSTYNQSAIIVIEGTERLTIKRNSTIETSQNFTVSWASRMNNTDFGFVLEWKCTKLCCPVISLSGSQINFLNQLYF